MWQANPDVLVTDLEDELILMHVGNAEMFRLNCSGRVIWQALSCTTQDAGKALSVAFEVDAHQAHRDAEMLLMELAERGIIHPV